MNICGFRQRSGHTAQYYGMMDGTYFSQLPKEGSDKAFSNYHWSLTNDHIRIFGPLKKGNKYYWIGSASREQGIAHYFVSFEKAVNEVKTNFIRYSNAKILGVLPINNIINNEEVTTGDHNGLALIIKL